MKKNNKLFTKLSTLVVSLAMALGVGVAAASSGGYKEARADDTYSLANSISNGDVIIFVGIKNEDYYAMSSTQSTNNRQGVLVTLTNDKIVVGDGIATFTVTDEGDDGYTFKDQNNKFIYNASSSSNSYLKSLETISDADKQKAHWSVSISEGVATISSKSTNRPNMRFNKNGNNTPLFNCYASGQDAVLIYKKNAIDPNAPSVKVTNNNKLAPHGVAIPLSAAITNDNDYTITWSTDLESGYSFSTPTGETTTITINDTVNPGTVVTISATLNSENVAKDSTILVVASKNPNSTDNAITAGEAKAIVSTNKANGINNFYVKGYVSAADTNDKKYFWLSDNKDTTQTFEIYNSSVFNPIPTVGSFVVAHGSTLYYAQSSTSEVTAGVVDSQQYVELSSSESEVDMTQSIVLSVNNLIGGDIIWSATPGTGSVTLSNQSNSGVTITGETSGTATITATVGVYSTSCNITVNEYATDWAYKDITLTTGAGFKSTQYVGDDFDDTDVVVTLIEHSATLDEDRKTVLNNDAVTFNFNSSKEQVINLTATYQGHTTDDEVVLTIVVKPITILFGSDDGRIKINSVSVSGKDSDGNNWTITTVMDSTSFTQSAGYSQVGSSSKPATSIEFTTTLAENVLFTSFYGNFGGFSGTAGAITLKINDAVVGTGNLNTTSDVMVEAENNKLAVGSKLTITIDNIVKGVKCYDIGYTYKAADNLLNDLIIANPKTNFTVGDKFEVGDAIKANYSLSGEKTVSEGLSYAFKNSSAITTNTTLTIDDNGKTVVVTYEDENGGVATKEYAIVVSYAIVTSITLDRASEKIAIDGELELVVSFNAGADPDTEIIWSSTNEDVAMVEDGTVLGISAGKATIIAKTAGYVSDEDTPDLKATCVITVTAEPIVTLNTSSITGKYSGDEAATLTASANNFEGDVTYQWSSSNEAVATVTGNSNTATVNFVGGGNATITVTASSSSSGEKSATCAVTVTQSTATLDNIASQDGNKMYLGTEKTTLALSANVNIVGNATNTVTWSSNNEAVATVSDAGVVTAVGAGNATIAATSSTGNAKTFDVSVLTPTALRVASEPTKTTYRIGDTFDSTGLAIKAVFGEEEFDAVGYELSGPDMTSAGTKEVTVNLLGKEVKFTITVLEDSYYTKIVDPSDLKAGDKLILVAPNKTEGTYDYLTLPLSNYFNVETANIGDNGIKQTDAIAANELILGGQEGAWTLANSEGKLLGISGNSNNKLVWVDADSETVHTWTITFNENGTFSIKSTDSAKGSLQYNSTTPRFSNYTNNSQTNPFLYKVGAKSAADILNEKKQQAISNIETYVATLNQNDYSATNWTAIQTLVSGAKTNVNAATDEAGINTAVSELKTEVAKIKTAAQEAAEALANAKTDAKEELATYYDAIDQSSYNAAGKEALANALSTGNSNIDAATTVDAVNNALAAAKQALDDVEKVELKGITVTAPDKTEYYVGDTLDTTGLVVTATYSDGSTSPVTGYTLSEVNMSIAENKTITVTYGGKTATFEIIVKPVTLESIAVTTNPTKTTYTVGETLDTTGLVVTATYNNGTTATVTGYTLSDVDMSTAGSKTVTVTYKEGDISKTATFVVTVNEAPATLESIAVTTNPTKTTYTVGETLDTTGLVVTATYNNGTTATVTGYTLSDVDMSTAGSKTVTVTYKEGDIGKTATFVVTVNEAPVDELAVAKANAISELEALVNSLNQADYSEAKWAEIQSLLSEARNNINAATVDSVNAVTELLNNAKNAINSVSNKATEQLAAAKVAAISDLESYYNDIDKSKYNDEGLVNLASALEAGKAAINAANNIDGVNSALANAKVALDNVEQAAPARKKCGGEVVATSAILSSIALLGVGLLLVKKRKED